MSGVETLNIISFQTETMAVELSEKLMSNLSVKAEEGEEEVSHHGHSESIHQTCSLVGGGGRGGPG